MVLPCGIGDRLYGRRWTKVRGDRHCGVQLAPSEEDRCF